VVLSVAKNKEWFSLDMFKDYFDVTNMYVIEKMKVIFLPFLVKEEEWKPKRAQPNYYGDETSLEKATPRTDTQAFDLYIPLMSFVTFILWAGLAEGVTKDT